MKKWLDEGSAKDVVRSMPFLAWLVLAVSVTILFHYDVGDELIADYGLTSGTVHWARLSAISIAVILAIFSIYAMRKSKSVLFFATIIGTVIIIQSDDLKEAGITEPFAKHGTRASEMKLVDKSSFDFRLIRRYTETIDQSPLLVDWRASSVSEHPHQQGLPTWSEADDMLRSRTKSRLDDFFDKVRKLHINEKAADIAEKLKRGE